MTGASDRPGGGDARWSVSEMGVAAAELLSTVHTACFAHGWDAEAFRDLLSVPGTWALVATDEAGAQPQVMGFALLRLIGDDCEILTFGVLPASRRRGVARTLLVHVCRHAAAAGASAVFLEVAESNTAARALYAGQGFLPAGRRRDYYRDAQSVEDAIVMTRRLTASDTADA